MSCEEVKLSQLNPVKIKSWLDNIVGKCKISPDRNGGLIVTCTMAGGSNLLKVSKFENHKIEIKRFIPKVYGKGIIHGVSDEYSDEELKTSLSAPGKKVIDVKRLGKTKSVVITFSSSVLPSHVFYGYLRFSVKLFIPSPVRCYNCQRFGHIAGRCRAEARCAKCGETHETKSCKMTEKEKCANCHGDHKASSKECKYFEEAKVIVKVKTEQKLSYAEAIKKVKGKKMNGKPNEASIAANSLPTRVTPSSAQQQTKTFASMAQVPAPFDWNEFAAFMVRASHMFSEQSYQNKSDVEKIAVFAEMIKDCFHVQVDRNLTCHALFDQTKTITVFESEQSKS